jgi:hypothetical protein
MIRAITFAAGLALVLGADSVAADLQFSAQVGLGCTLMIIALYRASQRV